MQQFGIVLVDIRARPKSPCACVTSMSLGSHGNPAFSDEPKTVYEGYYKIENTFIFTWSLVPSIEHFH
jgi:hypothetical protein